MIQKAGSTDNTLGVNGWQSADHWFVANLGPESKHEVGQIVWINLGPTLLKYLSFANYRISTLRDGGRVCMGVLSGGVLSQRPDDAKKVASAAAVSLPIIGDLPDLSKAFTKTRVSLESAPIDKSSYSQTELGDKKAIPNEINSNNPIDLPVLPNGYEKPSEYSNTVLQKNEKAREEKKSSNTLFLIIGSLVLASVVGGYFLTRPDSPVPIVNADGGSKPESTTKPLAATELPSESVTKMPGPTPSLPKNSSSNNSRSSSGDSPTPDLNKIVKDAINK